MARPLTGRAQTVEASDAALAAALLDGQGPSNRRQRIARSPHSICGSASPTWRTSISPPPSSSIRRTRRRGTAWRASGATGDSRIWRCPTRHRAVYYAPDSPVVHNTLGTVLQALGRRAEARAQYEKALARGRDAPPTP